jgi:anti-sigma B factor antagonist
LGDVEYRDASTGMLAVGVFDDAGSRVIRVSGELDLATVPSLEQELQAALERADGHRVVLDLSDLEFIDSTGIAVLVRAMGNGDGNEDGNGDARLRFVPSRCAAVVRVLEMTGVAERMLPADGIA